MNEHRMNPAIPPGPEETMESGPLSRPSYVVGIGASAGGLEALERLFERMPVDTGMAFVVVQHLSPDFKSVMDELLARKTRIPIHRVEEGMEVAPDAIYLIPPRKDMIIANGRLLLTDKDPRQVVTLPIDHFFRSLAHDCGDRAIGIILSGTGSDGSRGIRDIRQAGGLVIIQTPETAKFDGMPNSARQTGAFDLLLPPEEMPAALVQYVHHAPVVWADQERGSDHVPEHGLDLVFRLLREAYGIDFSHYKATTVTRRVERRLLLNRSNDLDDYVKRLREDPEELNALYKDLLIGVTHFFRDPEAFERLAADVLSGLLTEADRDEGLRLWVAGCATGEEAYSLAILVHETMQALNRSVNVKIFATDVHRASLDFAGAGVYSEAQLADVSPARRTRYFVAKGDGYQVAHDIRQMVVFAPHNVIKDAPFTKLDLISCRNLLIYLQPLAQRKVLSLFHFALKTGGILFLGPSESPGELSDEFAPLDNRWKVYRKRRDIRLPADLRLPLSSGGAPPGGLPARPVSAVADNLLLGTYDALLDRFMPPSLLVNERRELVESFGGANRYLRLRERRISTDVLDLVDPELKIMLNGALPRVFVDKASVTYKGLRVHDGEREHLVNLTVLPVVNRRSNVLHALIMLEDQGEAPPLPPATEVDLGHATQEQLLAFESELRYTKENLQATIEELETSNEELQATNEELVASNEELQSTNEELHSVNEELYSVNAEYQNKIAELTELTADMDNLLESTQVHTLFLDRNLCIRKFTPRIAETFHLVPQDVGRRIDVFRHGIDHPSLTDDIRRVMESGRPFEKQVHDPRGRWFLLRILPYLSKGAIDGVVLTLTDLTAVKRAEAEARAKDLQLSALLKNSPHPVFIKDVQGRYLVANQALEQALGCDPVGKTVHDFYPPHVADQLARLDQRVLTEQTTVEAELVLPGPQGPRTFLAVKFPIRDDQGKIVAVGGFRTDVTRLTLAEQRAREAVEQRDRFLAMLSHELRNPLGAIVNAAEVLALKAAAGSSSAEAVGVIQRQADQMSRLLDDLLEVSRITQNKIHLQTHVVRLDEIISEAVNVVLPALERGQLAYEVKKDDGPTRVVGDPARLQQMVVNLLMNAVKYTPAGGRVRVELRREGGEAVLRVQDTGVGIRPEILPRVFDLFVQADDSLDRSGGGLGVGLTLVRAIAELHHGSIRAASAGPGRGSEFVVHLPLATSEAVLAEKPASRSTDGAGTILLVEDNEDSRRMLAALLQMDGYRVLTARDGQEGVEAILRHRPTAAIIDIGLPVLDGYETARQVRARLGRDGVFLVALTGYGRPEDRRAVFEAGFDEHLVKPLRRSDLERLLEKVRQRC